MLDAYFAKFAHLTPIPRAYSVYKSNLGIGATETLSIAISEKADFLMYRVEAFAHSNATRTTVGNAKVLIRDNVSGRTLWDSALPIEMLSPTGRESAWPIPYLFQGGTNVGVDVVSDDAAAIDIYVALFGFHLYEQGQV